MNVQVRVIVGLGNPGPTYDHTRHNIGFDVLDVLAKSEGIRFRRSWVMPAMLAKWKRPGGTVLLVKPLTFMNRSGLAVLRAMRRQACGSEAVLVIFDDVELDAGRIRIRPKGRAGGHNGVQSVADVLGTETFPRIRVGVGPRPDGKDLINYVLSKWPDELEQTAANLSCLSAEAAKYVVDHGVEKAMNVYNARRA
jgi:peptidyl-tRNA hydrolase, PTH1 family